MRRPRRTGWRRWVLWPIDVLRFALAIVVVAIALVIFAVAHTVRTIRGQSR